MAVLEPAGCMWMATLLELQLVDERSFWRGCSERFDDQTIISYIDKKNVWIRRDDRLQINTRVGLLIAEASFLLPVLVVVAKTLKEDRCHICWRN